MSEKTFTVATYYDPQDGPPSTRTIRGYLAVYNRTWPGCHLYRILATNGSAAKAEAIKARITHERAARGASRGESSDDSAKEKKL